MKLLNVYSIKGPNIYSYNPVIVMDIDLVEYRDTYTDELPEVTNQLIKLFPGLKEHECSKGYPGGFLERLRKGTLLGHVTEHLALELQSIVHKPVRFGKTRYADDIEGYRIVYSYYNEALGIEAGKQAFWCIDTLLKGGTVNSEEVISHLQDTFRDNSYGTSTQALVDAASKRGIPVLPLSTRSSLVQLGYGSAQKRIQATITSQTSCIAVDLACDKWETREILSQFGIPVARGYLVQSEEEAIKAMEELDAPVVVKPLDGNQGKGVTLNITNPWELKRAYDHGKQYTQQILIEEFIKGNDYRLTIINGKLVAASHRLPPFIVGDGIHTIRHLIQEINKDAQRGDGHEKPLTKIRVDQVVLLSLNKQGLSLDSVLPEGEQIFLRENGNLSTGGTAYDVTEQVHPENQLMVERAARVIGLDVAGIDLRTEDISRPISRYGGAIIEINAAPGIRMHHYPTAGKERNVAEQIIDCLFPTGDGRIPIFAITGTNGKTTTTRLVQHVLLQTGKNIGMTTTDGIYLNHNMLFEGDTTGPWSANMVLKDPSVDIAVLETARGGILRSGLAFDKSDVGIVLNVSEDHLGLNGIDTLEDLAAVKSLVVETVHKEGTCVLNADNPYTAAMAEKCVGKVIYISQQPDNPVIAKHLWAGGTAVVAVDGMVEIQTVDATITLAPIAEIPMTYQGKARHQVENLLAAVAGLYGFGLRPELIHEGLLTFKGDIQTNPGRLNMIEHNGWKLLLDYGHNYEGWRAIIDFAHGLESKRLLGVIGVPGDRKDDSIRKVGQLAGDNFHQVWIKEDNDLRGRKQGEVAEILTNGLLQGKNGTKYEIVYNEIEALKGMLAELKDGDLGVIFYEKDPQALLKIIENFIENSLTEENRTALVANSSR